MGSRLLLLSLALFSPFFEASDDGRGDEIPPTCNTEVEIDWIQRDGVRLAGLGASWSSEFVELSGWERYQFLMDYTTESPETSPLVRCRVDTFRQDSSSGELVPSQGIERLLAKDRWTNNPFKEIASVFRPADSLAQLTCRTISDASSLVINNLYVIKSPPAPAFAPPEFDCAPSTFRLEPLAAPAQLLDTFRETWMSDWFETPTQRGEALARGSYLPEPITDRAEAECHSLCRYEIVPGVWSPAVGGSGTIPYPIGDRFAETISRFPLPEFSRTCQEYAIRCRRFSGSHFRLDTVEVWLEE